MTRFATFWALALLALAAPAFVQAQTTPPALGSPPPAAPAAPADDYLLGRSYQVETMQGTSFTGKLVGMSLTALDFEAQEVGRVSVERTQLRRAVLQGDAPRVGLRPGFFDIGNGNRLFFAPTARGLRRGEGSLQAVTVFLLGANYGLTDNFSVGGYLSVIPNLAPRDQVLVLTPKVSFPVSENLHVGAGVLYLRIPNGNGKGIGAGIGYGVLTYGSADNNLTLGLGYGFAKGEIGTTPVLQFGGQKRVSRRVSLISENYIIADSEAGILGFYGAKINWRRTSLGLGALYVYTYGGTRTEQQLSFDVNGNPVYTTRTYQESGDFQSTYILPAYIDFTFRFGKGAN